tara:strand:+ start:598 stop:1083 length:486 start_codon:yes stop_codon:yes gene_type:complete
MDIRVSKIEAPIPPNAENNGRKSYRVTTDAGIKYFASPKIGLAQVKESDMITIEFSPDKFGNKWINSFEPITDINADINNDVNKIKETFPDSKVVSNNDYSTLEINNNKPIMTSKDFLIVLQSCVNRQANWTPTQKLKFILDNYFAGITETHKSLDDGESF